MAIKLFPMRNVPQDEADEMRALLLDHDIEYHETQAGFWGIGTAAIWINDETQYETAKNLIAMYQTERFKQARSEYQNQLESGDRVRFIDMLRRNPLKVGSYILFALFLIYLMARPFWF